MNTTIIKAIRNTGNAVKDEIFCLELATLMCAPLNHGAFDVARCMTSPGKYLLVRDMKAGRLHICVSPECIEVRMIDDNGAVIKNMVPECQTVMRNAVAAYIEQVKAFKEEEERRVMDSMFSEITGEIGGLHAGLVAANAVCGDRSPQQAPKPRTKKPKAKKPNAAGKAKKSK